jgi:hypothetical protein
MEYYPFYIIAAPIAFMLIMLIINTRKQIKSKNNDHRN